MFLRFWRLGRRLEFSFFLTLLTSRAFPSMAGHLFGLGGADVLPSERNLSFIGGGADDDWGDMGVSRIGLTDVQNDVVAVAEGGDRADRIDVWHFGLAGFAEPAPALSEIGADAAIDLSVLGGNDTVIVTGAAGCR